MENERTENIFYLNLKHVHKYGSAKFQPNPLFSSQQMGTEHGNGRKKKKKKVGKPIGDPVGTGCPNYFRSITSLTWSSYWWNAAGIRWSQGCCFLLKSCLLKPCWWNWALHLHACKRLLLLMRYQYTFMILGIFPNCTPAWSVAQLLYFQYKYTSILKTTFNNIVFCLNGSS